MGHSHELTFESGEPVGRAAGVELTVWSFRLRALGFGVWGARKDSGVAQAKRNVRFKPSSQAARSIQISETPI